MQTNIGYWILCSWHVAAQRPWVPGHGTCGSATDTQLWSHLLILTVFRFCLELNESMFRRSPDLDVRLSGSGCQVRLPAHTPGCHVIQFLKPLTPENSYFHMEIRKAGEWRRKFHESAKQSPRNKSANYELRCAVHVSRNFHCELTKFFHSMNVRLECVVILPQIVH